MKLRYKIPLISGLIIFGLVLIVFSYVFLPFIVSESQFTTILEITVEENQELTKDRIINAIIEEFQGRHHLLELEQFNSIQIRNIDSSTFVFIPGSFTPDSSELNTIVQAVNSVEGVKVISEPGYAEASP